MRHRHFVGWIFSAALLSAAATGGCNGARDAECRAWADAFRAQNLGSPHEASQFSRGKGKAEPMADVVKAMRAFTTAVAPKPGQKTTEVTPLIASYVAVVDERATLLERAGTPAEIERKKAEHAPSAPKPGATEREKMLAEAVQGAMGDLVGKDTLSEATHTELTANKAKGDPICSSLWEVCGSAIP